MTVITDYCFPWLSSFIYINFEPGTLNLELKQR